MLDFPPKILHSFGAILITPPHTPFAKYKGGGGEHF